MKEQLARIAHMENCMDRCREAVNAMEAALDALEGCAGEQRELRNYYEGGQWQRDYEADEAGELPPQMKRGVLSQDALYDLLEEMDTMRKRMQDLLQEEQ